MSTFIGGLLTLFGIMIEVGSIINYDTFGFITGFLILFLGVSIFLLPYQDRIVEYFKNR
jgi:hypothetical protein